MTKIEATIEGVQNWCAELSNIKSKLLEGISFAVENESYASIT